MAGSTSFFNRITYQSLRPGKFAETAVKLWIHAYHQVELTECVKLVGNRLLPKLPIRTVVLQKEYEQEKEIKALSTKPKEIS